MRNKTIKHISLKVYLSNYSPVGTQPIYDVVSWQWRCRYIEILHLYDVAGRRNCDVIVVVHLSKLCRSDNAVFQWFVKIRFIEITSQRRSSFVVDSSKLRRSDVAISSKFISVKFIRNFRPICNDVAISSKFIRNFQPICNNGAVS